MASIINPKLILVLMDISTPPYHFFSIFIIGKQFFEEKVDSKENYFFIPLVIRHVFFYTSLNRFTKPIKRSVLW